MTGRLLICATPIGNLSDATPRLAEALGGADLVLAEDTRKARHLMGHLGVGGRVMSFFAGNEEERLGLLAEALSRDETVAVVTDAGMPGISDPGMSAVRRARREGAQVSVIPGPSAVTAAVAVSGLASERFVFEGFLPRKGQARQRRLSHLGEESRTIVLFSATNRVLDDLESLTDALGSERPVTVCRELTKMHEEVWSGSLGTAIEEWVERRPRGEFTLVVAGRPGTRPDLQDAVTEVQVRIGDGAAMSDAVRVVAENLSIRRRALYEAVLNAEERADGAPH